METKQTAVEWLYDKFIKHDEDYLGSDYWYLNEWFEQAKEIEKEQIESAFRNGVFPADYFDPENPQIEPPQLYYNITYGKETDNTGLDIR